MVLIRLDLLLENLILRLLGHLENLFISIASEDNVSFRKSFNLSSYMGSSVVLRDGQDGGLWASVVDMIHQSELQEGHEHVHNTGDHPNVKALDVRN